MEKVDFQSVLPNEDLAKVIWWLSYIYEVELLTTKDEGVYYFNDLQESDNNRYMSLYEFIKYFYDDMKWKIEEGFFIDGDYKVEEWELLKQYIERGK